MKKKSKHTNENFSNLSSFEQKQSSEIENIHEAMENIDFFPRFESKLRKYLIKSFKDELGLKVKRSNWQSINDTFNAYYLNKFSSITGVYGDRLSSVLSDVKYLDIKRNILIDIAQELNWPMDFLYKCIDIMSIKKEDFKMWKKMLNFKKNNEELRTDFILKFAKQYKLIPSGDMSWNDIADLFMNTFLSLEKRYNVRKTLVRKFSLDESDIYKYISDIFDLPIVAYNDIYETILQGSTDEREEYYRSEERRKIV